MRKNIFKLKLREKNGIHWLLSKRFFFADNNDDDDVIFVCPFEKYSNIWRISVLDISNSNTEFQWKYLKNSRAARKSESNIFGSANKYKKNRLFLFVWQLRYFEIGVSFSFFVQILEHCNSLHYLTLFGI